MDLYSVGEMLVDFLPGSEPGSYIRNAGGAPANVAIAAARNGLEAATCWVPSGKTGCAVSGGSPAGRRSPPWRLSL